MPKFAMISLFLATPPKSLLRIPLDSLKREDSRTIFKIPFGSRTRPHALQEGRRLPSQLPRVTSWRRPRHQLCFCAPDFVFRPIRAYRYSFLGFLTAPDATVSSVLPNSVYIFKYGFI